MASKRNKVTERCSKRLARKSSAQGEVVLKEEAKERNRQVFRILKKAVSDRTPSEEAILQASPDVVALFERRAQTRETAKQRQLEIEDPSDVIDEKCHQLAHALQAAQSVVVYTGAGISTAASIPDYRGPQGVWTLLQQGKDLMPQDLSQAEPTLTHMCIAKLHYEHMVDHVVSQNCDGLHLRSGLPRDVLSEVHGNMYIEICRECSPQREYLRLFDVTEHTSYRRHDTGRFCQMCDEELRDSIVHFGEKGGMLSPYNWEEAADTVDECDLILCLGSSLKVLRRYPCLWYADRRPRERPQLYIVNLQWTPKDDMATLKINGKCDTVMQKVMAHLQLEVPVYERSKDPIFQFYTALTEEELNTTSKELLQIPDETLKPKFAYIKGQQTYKCESDRQQKCQSNCAPDHRKATQLLVEQTGKYNITECNSASSAIHQVGVGAIPHVSNHIPDIKNEQIPKDIISYNSIISCSDRTAAYKQVMISEPYVQRQTNDERKIIKSMQVATTGLYPNHPCLSHSSCLVRGQQHSFINNGSCDCKTHVSYDMCKKCVTFPSDKLISPQDMQTTALILQKEEENPTSLLHSQLPRKLKGIQAGNVWQNTQTTYCHDEIYSRTMFPMNLTMSVVDKALPRSDIEHCTKSSPAVIRERSLTRATSDDDPVITHVEHYAHDTMHYDVIDLTSEPLDMQMEQSNHVTQASRNQDHYNKPVSSKNVHSVLHFTLPRDSICCDNPETSLPNKSLCQRSDIVSAAQMSTDHDSYSKHVHSENLRHTLPLLPASPYKKEYMLDDFYAKTRQDKGPETEDEGSPSFKSPLLLKSDSPETKDEELPVFKVNQEPYLFKSDNSGRVEKKRPAKADSPPNFEVTKTLVRSDSGSGVAHVMSISDNSFSKKPTLSVPGWFGKGLNIKKRKRRRLQSQSQ